MTPDSSPPPSAVPPPAHPPAVDEEVDLFVLWGVLKKAKWLIFFVTTLFTVGAGVLAFTMIPIYRAEVLLEFVSSDGNQARSAMMSQASGLASMVGIRIPTGGGGSGPSKEATLARLKSRAFIEKFISDENLLPIFFFKEWDEQSHQWRPGPPETIPTLWHGVEFFRGICKVSEDIKTGLITLSIEWRDREVAARWANLVVQRINAYLRNQAIRDSQESIKYLTAELEKTTVVDIRQILIGMMEESIKNNMFASVRSEFAFKVIDPAVIAPKGKVVRPVKRVMVMVGFAIGILVGATIAIFRNALQRQKRKRQRLSAG
ncbi:MAG: hypothetical protein HQL66_01920 [Magnetococcales bacterium]|nr:hypothetical protein [Magnetococcales bacterium]